MQFAQDFLCMQLDTKNFTCVIALHWGKSQTFNDLFTYANELAPVNWRKLHEHPKNIIT